MKQFISGKLSAEKEKYLFKLAKAVLHWADVDYTDEELADLVMLNLAEIKE